MLIQTTRVDCFWGVVLRGPQTNIDGCVCGCNICNPNGSSKHIALRIRYVSDYSGCKSISVASSKNGNQGASAASSAVQGHDSLAKQGLQKMQIIHDSWLFHLCHSKSVFTHMYIYIYLFIYLFIYSFIYLFIIIKYIYHSLWTWHKRGEKNLHVLSHNHLVGGCATVIPTSTGASANLVMHHFHIVLSVIVVTSLFFLATLLIISPFTFCHKKHCWSKNHGVAISNLFRGFGMFQHSNIW